MGGKRKAAPLDQLKTELAGEDQENIQKSLTEHVPGDAHQKEGNNPNGGIQADLEKGAGDGDDDEDDEEEGEGDDMGGSADGDDDLEKSLSKYLNGDDNLVKSMDASPFLEAMVDGIDECFDGIRADMNKSFGAIAETNQLLGQGVLSLMRRAKQQDEIIKSLTDTVESLNTSLSAALGRPQKPKSVQAGQQAVLQKSINGNPTGPGDQGAIGGSLADRQRLTEKLVKSVTEGKVDRKWVSFLDYNGHLPEDVLAVVNQQN